MSRTTEQWEALLEGATEGPWKWDSHRVPTLYGTIPSSTGDYEFQVDVLDADHDGGCGCRQACELELHVSDADKALLAAAPESVAEVVRLRRELEEVRHDMQLLAEQSNSDPASNAYAEAENRLTTILNPKDKK
ncbi:hypothetical protein [Corynebacterium sp. A21]|uniref:hypothetical protein n=1 Tax=Corynebacterium sp. A21 TaxID=3457318 RepID=UPI003FD5E499